MIKHVKLIAAVLAIALLSSLIGACTSSTTTTTTTATTASTTKASETSAKPFAGQKIVIFSFAGWLNDGVEATVSEKAQKATGMTVEYIIVPWAERFSKMTVMVAGKQQIDITGKSTPSDMAILCDSGVLLPINDYINKSTVFSKDNWLGWDYMDLMTYAKDGKWYGVPTRPPQGYIWTINKAWLDELKLSVPKTLDEVISVLQAFKTADLGEGATIPIAHQFPNSDHIATFLGMWGVKGPGIMKDESGKVYHPWLTENGLAGLKWMQDMYAAGLLDPEFATENGTTIYDKVKSGKVGIFLDWPGSNLAYNQAAATSGAKCNFISMQIPQAISGVTPVNCGNTIIMDNIVSTTANADAAWAFIEYLSTSQGIIDWTWTEGVNYKKAADGKIEFIVTQLHSSGSDTQSCLTKDFFKNPAIFPATQETLDGYKVFFDSWAFPKVLAGAGDAEEIAVPLATKVIVNQLSIEEFETQLRSQLLAKKLIDP